MLQEADSPLAKRLACSDVELLVPDFWLNEACNVLWLQVRRKLFTPNEAREALALLRAQVEPTPTAELSLHDVALEIAAQAGAVSGISELPAPLADLARGKARTKLAGAARRLAALT